MRLIHGDPSVQVVVKTGPPGAKITLDQRELGLSPVTFEDPSGSKKSYVVRIEKEGYRPVTRTIRRTWDTMRLTYRLDPIYYYSLTPLPGAEETLVASAVPQEKRKPAQAPIKASVVDEIPTSNLCF